MEISSESFFYLTLFLTFLVLLNIIVSLKLMSFIKSNGLKINKIEKKIFSSDEDVKNNFSHISSVLENLKFSTEEKNSEVDDESNYKSARVLASRGAGVEEIVSATGITETEAKFIIETTNA